MIRLVFIHIGMVKKDFNSLIYHMGRMVSNFANTYVRTKN